MFMMMMMIITGSPVLSLGWSDLCDKYINSPRRGSGRDIAVFVFNCYKLDDFGFEPRWVRHFPRPSREILFPTQPAVEWLHVLPLGSSGRGVALNTHLASRWNKDLSFRGLLHDEFLPLPRRGAIDSNLLDRARFCRELALVYKCVRQHVSYKRFVHTSLRQKIKMIQRKPAGWLTYIQL